MNAAQIIKMQRRLGVAADGFWGPQSMAACQKHLRRLMPKGNPWPAADQKSLTAFYGAAGDESKLVNLPVTGLGLKYAGKAVRTVRCHAKVAESLHRALPALRAWQDADDARPDILSEYNGSYNNRPMRGGSLPSLHARGAAVDFWAGPNGNHRHWPVAALMPLEVMEIFALEGWLPAGAFWGRDAMHFQATR